MEIPFVPAYAAFASVLYEANSGDFAAHLQELCENSSNVYVRHLAQERGLEIPEKELDARAEYFVPGAERKVCLERQFLDGLLPMKEL